ncbi:uncharacterized protein [Watersipora subatra]|uniref:uncharacterized protein n=1 Tax=Watersipora subatra TaxID=2589382 RepID=UPI00355AE46A
MGTNYHNEVLRKARVLERQRNAREFFQESPEERAKLERMMNDIKQRHAFESSNHASDSGNMCVTAADAVGVDRNRQTYDHSRNGPIRDDSNRSMRREATSMFGNKPKYMTNVWKG